MAAPRTIDPNKLDAYEARIVAILEAWERRPSGVDAPAPLVVRHDTNDQGPTEHLKDFTPGAKQIVAAAQRSADARKHAETDILHVLAAMLELDGVQKALADVGADALAALDAVRKELDALPRGTGAAYLSANLVSFLGDVRLEAAGAQVTVRQLLVASARSRPPATLEDLDGGIGRDRRYEARARVIAAGRLDRIGTP